jgi:eukaryotic-like serine/threonine-protein kinase
MIDRLNTALEGRYRVERELGEGGMATVYLAEDVKHRRKVAVKVLRPELAAVVGAERFLAEIETTANLQHPHILPLFDSGSADGFLFYVMPYVEGESLREKLNREKQLRVEDALALAGKVADALDYAHEKGVVHRDVKPANILLSQRGEPLVADFGIALAVSQAGGGRITETGLSLGTPHYMSPEQATGDRDVDPRSDVYALGCVLYEMLVGEPPFVAPTAQGVLVRILTEDPRSVTDVRRSVPPHVAAVISRSLEKLPADRFPSADAFARALGDPQFRYVGTPTPAPRGGASAAGMAGNAGFLTPRLVASAAGVLLLTLLVLGGLAVASSNRGRDIPAAQAPTSRFAVPLGEHSVVQSQLDLSRDGRTLVYSTGGNRPLYLRSMDALRAVPIRGTEGGRWPVFSPDGQWIAYHSSDGIRKIAITGGSPLRITARLEERLGLHWGNDGTLVYMQSDGIYRVPEQGGEAERILAGSPFSLRFPRLLPGGRAVLFSEMTGTGPESTGEIRVLDLGSGEVTTVVRDGSDARYLETRHLVYGQPMGALFAVPFDLETLTAAGTPFPVIDEIRVIRGFGATAFAASSVGTVAYIGSRDAGANRRFILVDRAGAREPIPLQAPGLDVPRFSPNGRKLAYEDGAHIYVYDLVIGTNTRVTFHGLNGLPVWTPAGDALVFSSAREGSRGGDLFRVPANGEREPELLWSEDGRLVPESWAPDGSRLLYTSVRQSGIHDLKVLDLRGDTRSAPYLNADWNEARGRISPDGRWVAYDSEEDGTREIYVRAFPDPGPKWKVSQGGGRWSRWAPDGRELYYWRDDTLVAATVRTEPSFQVLARTDVLSGQYGAYDVRPDGSGFVLTEQAPEAEGEDADQDDEADLVVVVNWFDELLRRAGRMAGGQAGPR